MATINYLHAAANAITLTSSAKKREPLSPTLKAIKSGQHSEDYTTVFYQDSTIPNFMVEYPGGAGASLGQPNLQMQVGAWVSMQAEPLIVKNQAAVQRASLVGLLTPRIPSVYFLPFHHGAA